jgi:hypothetical protein
MSPNDAFDATDEAFFRAIDAEDPKSLGPVTLQTDADDETELERAELCAQRRARFVRPVTKTVVGLAAASALALGWRWVGSAPGEEATAPAAAIAEVDPRPVIATEPEPLAEVAGDAHSSESEVNRCVMPKETTAEAEPISIAPRAAPQARITPAKEDASLTRAAAKPGAPQKIPKKHTATAGKRTRSVPTNITRQTLLAAIRGDGPAPLSSTRTKR